MKNRKKMTMANGTTYEVEGNAIRGMAVDDVVFLWERILNKPFYEEVTKSNTLEWDGDTTGLVNVAGYFYKMSDTILTDEEIKSCTLEYLEFGEKVVLNLSEVWEEITQEAIITDDIVALPNLFIIRKSGVTLMDEAIFNETGIYFYKEIEDGSYQTTKLICSNPVFDTITVTPLPEKFLPDSVKALLEIVNGSEVAW